MSSEATDEPKFFAPWRIYRAFVWMLNISILLAMALVAYGVLLGVSYELMANPSDKFRDWSEPEVHYPVDRWLLHLGVGCFVAGLVIGLGALLAIPLGGRPGGRWYPNLRIGWFLLAFSVGLAACLVLVFIAGSQSPERWSVVFVFGPAMLGMGVYAWIKER